MLGSIFSVLLASMAILAINVPEPATAADSPAEFVTKLFTDACVTNLARPGKVREWAEAHRLAQIDAPAALGIFVGPGANGGAWAIPAAQGSFALSIRGTTQACAVWARTADPDEVLANFQTLVDGVKRPGIVVAVEKDETSSGPSGNIHALAYSVGTPDSRGRFILTLLTAERPGGAFQASMQAAPASGHEELR